MHLRVCPFSALVAVLVSYVLMVWAPAGPHNEPAEAGLACWAADQAADDATGNQAGGWVPGGIDG